MKLTKKQLGTRNKKITGGKSKTRRLLPPWGRAVRGGKSSSGTVGGSTRKPQSPDPSLRGMQYPANQPHQWPVEPDFEDHTLAPPSSGYTSDVAAKHNAAVENAYTRAGYQ